MNFDKLYELVLEAGFRPSSPKNQGGARVNRAKNAEGPGIASIDQGIKSEFGASSVGRNDNPESYVPTDIKKKYGVDPEKLGTAAEMGYEEIAEARKNMHTAFGLLFNNKHFFSNFKNIIKDRLHIDSISAEDEKEWNRAKDEADARRTNTTGLRNELEKVDNLFKQVEEYKAEEAQIEFHISQLKENIKNTEDADMKKMYADDLKDSQIDLQNVKTGLSTMKPDALQKLKDDIQSKLTTQIEMEMTAEENWENIQEKISQVSENNIKSNENTLRGMKGEIKRAAEALFDQYHTLNDVPEGEVEGTPVNWSKDPKTLMEKLAMLYNLSKDDGENPIFKFIAKIEQQFDDKFQDMDSNYMNKNINISMMRIFEKLPSVIMAKYFNTIAGRGVERKTIPLDSLGTSATYKSYSDLKSALEKLSDKNKWLEGQKELLPMIAALPFSKMNKDILTKKAKQFWEVNRRGEGINKQLMYQLDSMKNEESKKMNIKESFDQLANQYMKAFTFDENDFKVDLLEVASHKRKVK